MCRLFLIFIVILCTLTTAAHDKSTGKYTGNPALDEEVPVYHWSYLALDLLQREGVLVEYPNGYFIREEALTRFELSYVIIGLMRRQSINSDKCQEHDVILIKALSTEYYCEIAEATPPPWWPDDPLNPSD